jgi:hypothetical protein
MSAVATAIRPNPAAPLGSGHIGEIFLKQTIRMRGRHGKARVLRSAQPTTTPRDELYHLACAVLRQACADAGHPSFCKLHHRTSLATLIQHPYRRLDAWDALLFLTDPNDEWLDYWCALAGYNAASLRETFQPVREKFERLTGFSAVSSAPRESQPRLME